MGNESTVLALEAVLKVNVVLAQKLVTARLIELHIMMNFIVDDLRTFEIATERIPT